MPRNANDVSAARSIAADWGSSQLRLYLCAGDGQVLDQCGGPGIAALRGGQHAGIIATAIAPWRQAHGALPLRMAGMVGARNGWVEVPYVECPADAGMLRGRLQRFRAGDLDATIGPGLACRNPRGAPDVMRGEETQVFGALALQPALARGRRVLVLPGTHCKWVQLEDGRIQRFQTSFSGELFALLRRHSQLASALDGAHDEVAFGFGLARAQAVASLGQVLFEARSRQLREGMPASAADDFLSGLVIGSDVQGALDLLDWQADGLDIGLVGEPALCARYAQALAGQGRSCTRLDGAQCALAGLRVLAND